MSPDALFHMLAKAKAESGHSEFVIIGSVSILGMSGVAEIPETMLMSMDADVYTRADPSRIFDLMPKLGEDSPFHRTHGVYLDAVSPRLPTLPEGWEARLVRVQREGVTAWFLEPHDAAVSKLARGEPRDLRWVRAGLDAGLLTGPLVAARMRQTSFLDAGEQHAAAVALATITHGPQDDESGASGCEILSPKRQAATRRMQ